MTYIHQHQDWPKISWDLDVLSPKLAEVHHRKGMLIGSFKDVDGNFQQEAVLRTLSIEVVKSSEIEGEFIDLNQVRSSLARQLKFEIGGSIVTSENIDRVVSMTIDAVSNCNAPLTAQRLFDWHRALFPDGQSNGKFITTGAWRPLESAPMQVVSGPLGKERVHFEAPSPEKLSKEMIAFLRWVNDPKKIDPIVKAGIASFWFVTIHPFEDGNGRISRAIAEMLLARADKSKDRYYSMSSQIFSERKSYYYRLELQQKNGLDLTPWLVWFIECLDHALDRAEERLRNIVRNARFWQILSRFKLNDRQSRIIFRMLDESWRGHMNTSKYSNMGKCSDATSQRDMRDLVEKGIFVRNPTSGPKTSYKLRNLEEVKAELRGKSIYR